MTIQFNQIPVSLREPGQYAEFDSSRADQGVATIPQHVLLVGQKLVTGTAAAGVAVRVASADQVAVLVGRGSMLHQMAKLAFKANAFTPMSILPLADAGGSTKATRTLTITGPATATGELALVVGGTRYGVGVAAGDSATAIATKVVAAIAADLDAHVVATSAAGVVTLTAINAGIDAGNVPVVVNRYANEALPTGVAVVIAAITAGTVNPALAAPLTALGDSWYPTLVAPYTDATNLTAIETELFDRFGPIRQIDGYAFTAAGLSFANAIALGSGRNSPLLSIVDADDILTPPFALAASVAAVDAAEPDPGRPRQTLVLPGVVGKAESGRRTLAQRNQLIDAGISTLRVDIDGTVRISRLTTTYRLNSFDIRDDAYFDTESLHLLANLRYSLRARFSTRYPRHKLGKDGSVGANVMTPGAARAEIVALYIDTWMEQGWVEGGVALEQFKRDLLVELDATDPNRLNALVPPDLINQLRVFAAQIQFRR